LIDLFHNIYSKKFIVRIIIRSKLEQLIFYINAGGI